MKYTYSFNGTITVEAENEEEAYEKADDLLGLTTYQYDNCEDIEIGELTLIDEENKE